MSLETTDYIDLRISRGEASGSYRVELVSSSTKPAVTAMELPSGLDESLAAVRMDAPDPSALRELGSQLYHALFSGDVERAWNEIQNLYLLENERGPLIRLWVYDPDLERIPWELVYNGRSFLDESMAKVFAGAFYESLANGQPRDAAVKEARRLLSPGGHPAASERRFIAPPLREARRLLSPGGHPGKSAWFAPILYLCTPSADVESSGKVVAEQRSHSAALHEPHSTHPSADPGQGIPQKPPPLEAKICEEFQGFVEKIEGDKAYIRLDSQTGERFSGLYPAGEMIAVGIGERDRFLLKAVEVNGTIRFDAVLIPRKPISPERQREIREELEQTLGGFNPGFEGNTVLETFDGFVDRIEGDTAFVTLQSRANGDVEEGTYSAPELARMGIHEQSYFIFKTVDVGNAIRPVFEPVPHEPLADDVVRQIDAKIDQVLPHEDPGIKY